MDRRTFLSRTGTAAALGAAALSVPHVVAEAAERMTPPVPLDPFDFAKAANGGIHWHIRHGGIPTVVTVIGPRPTVEDARRMQEFLAREYGIRPSIRWAGSADLIYQAIPIAEAQL